MAELELLRLGSAAIEEKRLLVTISTPTLNTVYVYPLSLLRSVFYQPVTKILSIKFLDGDYRSYSNILSVENTQELNS